MRATDWGRTDWGREVGAGRCRSNRVETGQFQVLPCSVQERLPFWWGGLVAQDGKHSRNGECCSGDCVEFLKIRRTSPLRQPAEAAVGITAGGRRFQVRLLLVPEEYEYFVFLERLWFWGGLRRAGFQPVIADHTPNVETSLVRRARREDILY